MSRRHRYLVILSLDEKQISDIEKLFLGRFKIIVLREENALDFIQNDNGDIAGIIIDDSLNNVKIIDFLQTCYNKEIYKRIPMFLLYDGYNDDLYTTAVRLGIDEILRKPYVPDVLERRVIHITDLFTHSYRLEWLVDIQTKELQESIQVLEDMKIQVLEAMATLVEFRNLESGEHIYRVRFITDILIKALQKNYPEYGITDEMISIIDMASILHDVGKIMISDMILNKPERLTIEEFEEMKLHTYYGTRILDQFEGLYNDNTYRFYRDIICFHHEKFDGAGYPEGLRGNEIPIWSQIVSLADVYDALTNERVYKKAYDHEEAKTMIFNGDCGVFNPDILDCFVKSEEKIKDISQIRREKDGKFTDNVMHGVTTHILKDYEKEKAFHRAYQDLVTDYFFEFDTEYETVHYMNAFGKKSGDKYVYEDFPGMIKKDENRLKKAIKKASPNNPIIVMEVDITENGQTHRCELTMRTTWDMFNGKCTGGVGRLEFLDS